MSGRYCGHVLSTYSTIWFFAFDDAQALTAPDIHAEVKRQEAAFHGARGLTVRAPHSAATDESEIRAASNSRQFSDQSSRNWTMRELLQEFRVILQFEE